MTVRKFRACCRLTSASKPPALVAIITGPHDTSKLDKNSKSTEWFSKWCSLFRSKTSSYHLDHGFMVVGTFIIKIFSHFFFCFVNQLYSKIPSDENFRKKELNINVQDGLEVISTLHSSQQDDEAKRWMIMEACYGCCFIIMQFLL